MRLLSQPISEVHDIDTNKVEGSFQYLEKDEKNLLSAISENSNFKFEVDKGKNKVLFFNTNTNEQTKKGESS